MMKKVRKKTNLSLLFSKYRLNHNQLAEAALPKEAWEIFSKIKQKGSTILELKQRTGLPYTFINEFVNDSLANKYLTSSLSKNIPNPYSDHYNDIETTEEFNNDQEVICVDLSDETSKSQTILTKTQSPSIEINIVEENEVATFSFD